MYDNMVTSKPRIEFIDLAKGLCIILVIINHIRPFDIPGFQSMRMPLYYVLSGLFFKDYGGLFNLFIKKTNKLLIPFLFFYISSYLIFYIVDFIQPGLIQTKATGILDVFTQRQWFNGPIWFLLSLFWINLMFGVISLNVKKEAVRCVLVLITGGIGAMLAEYNIFTPLVIGGSMMALPFFYFGYILKKTSLLYPNKYDKYLWLYVVVLAAISVSISVLCDYPNVGFLYGVIHGNWVSIIIVSISSVLAVLLLCKGIKRVPYISYIGRYSIIPLCTHHLIYRPIKVLLMKLDVAYIDLWVVVITIILCSLCIPICIKYLPYVTAQKDLIKPVVSK